ncbi:MAG: hypothetical protein OEU59_10175, partial [Gammaproteobacteria bacterium]|nr:hypothetical protein [Gammaproteobacteria bacterium]
YRDQAGAGQVAESIAELAVRQKFAARMELARRVRLPVRPRLHSGLLMVVNVECRVTNLLRGYI